MVVVGTAGCRAGGVGLCLGARTRRGVSAASRHHSASCAGAAHGALRGARTLEAGLPAARGKVELGEVGSGGGAPRGGHREVVGSARGFRRIRGDPETPGTRNPELAGKQIGGGGGGPRRRGGIGDSSAEGVEVEERAETGAQGARS